MSLTLEHLLKAGSFQSPNETFATARALDHALGNPASAYPVIHIAGTNGKGSVATKIARVLSLSGYRVGLYTSPHLFSYTERISIDGETISENAAWEGLENLFALYDDLALTLNFFTATTFLAFNYFREKNVDIAVVETGIGGRCDATNVVHPILTVITSISLEHTQLLGKELELIAAEKAGILKENVPIILGPKARYQAIYDRAKEKNCPLFASKKISYFYDEENSATAQLALEHLPAPFHIPADALHEGLQVRPPCRFERVGDAILDVAHNPEGIFYLLQALHTVFPDARFRFLIGFCRDKDYNHCLELIAGVASHIHLVAAPSERSATLEELGIALKGESSGFFTSHSSVSEGVETAYALAKEQGETLVICGTFFIMKEAKEIILKPAVESGVIA